MALHPSKFLGSGPIICLRLQEAYDLWHAEDQLGRVFSKLGRY